VTSASGFSAQNQRRQPAKDLSRVVAVLHEPAGAREQCLGLIGRGAEALGNLGGDGDALTLRDCAIGLCGRHHHGCSRLASVIDRIERMLGVLPAPAPATKHAARVVGDVGDIARRIGRLLHAKEDNDKHGKNCAQGCKDMHGSLRCAAPPASLN